MPDQKKTISSETFLAGLRGLVQPVGLITAAGNGQRGGQTAVTISSATMDPPTMLVCIRQEVAVTELIKSSQAFAISFLADTQASIARQFSKEGSSAITAEDDRWYSAKTGAPMLKSALSSFECELTQVLPCGSHSLFFGRVVSMMTNDGDGLLYGDGFFRRLAAKDSSEQHERT